MNKLIKLLLIILLGSLNFKQGNAQTDTKSLKIFQMSKGDVNGTQRDSVVLWRKKDSLTRSVSVDSFQLTNSAKILTLTQEVSGGFLTQGQLGKPVNTIIKLKYTGSNGGLLNGFSVNSHSGDVGDVTGLTAIVSQQYLNRDSGIILVHIIGTPDNEGIAKFYIQIDTVQYRLDYLILAAVTAESYWQLSGNYGTDPFTQYLGTQDNTPLIFKTNDAFAMKLSENGKLGIGTDDPLAHLHVKNTSSSNRIFRAANDVGTDALTILNSGYVGIGTSFPLYHLDVEGKGFFKDTLIVPNAFINAITSGSVTDSLVTINDNGLLRKRSASLFTTDTTSLSNRINQKLNISDTASMLTNYKINANNGLTKVGNVISLGGTLNTATTIATSVTNTLAISGLQTGSTADSIVTINASDVLKKRTISSIVSEPWFKSGTTNGATANTDSVYINGNLGIGTSNPFGSLTLFGNSSITLPVNIQGKTDRSKEILFGKGGATKGLAAITAVDQGNYGGGLSFIVNGISGSDNFPANAKQVMVMDWNGNVGINKSNPSYSLHVGGFAKIDSISTITSASSMLVEDPSTGIISKQRIGFAKVVYTNASSPNSSTIFDTINNPVVNNASLAANSNYLYIGSDNSTWVYSGSNSTYESYLGSGSTTEWYLKGTTIDAGGNKSSNISRTGGVYIGSKIALDTSGKIGIGTFSPSGSLNLYGETPLTGYIAVPSASRTSEINFSKGGATAGLASIQGLDYNGYIGGLAFNVSTGSNYPTNSLTPMLIKGNDIGIGTLSPQYQLDLRTSNGTGLYIESNPVDVNGQILLNAKPTGGFSSAQQEFIFFQGNSVNIGNIAANSSGTGVVYNTTSDVRLKENIVNTSFTIDDLMKIEIKDYNFKSDLSKSKNTGVIAQQLHTIIPGIVAVGGDDVAKNPWTVDYSKLTPYLIKAVQDQQYQIQQLKTEKDKMIGLIEKLTKRIEILENK